MSNVKFSQDYTIYAVKAPQPWDKEANYWIPLLYDQLKEGKARFGWSYNSSLNLNDIKKKIENGVQLSNSEKDAWDHASFLLGVKEGDYFIYVNMPEWSKCSIVRIKGEYNFDVQPWDPQGKDDFRHWFNCEFIATFDRNADIVHPYLSKRLKLQGAWYRIYAKAEFEELLEAIKTGAKGKTPRERLNELIGKSLENIAYETYKHFPDKNLEPLVKELLENYPYVKEVRKGPDTKGADLELVFEIPLGLSSFQFLCAVQVKSYEGDLGYKKAIEDIKKAFDSKHEYACGLIVSTALKYTEDFEKELENLRKSYNKPVEVLLGKDLSYLLVQNNMSKDIED